MYDLLAPLFVGLVGSLHCMGMCGPIVLAYSLQVSARADATVAVGSRAGLLHHLSFHLGRIISYGFLGLLAGAVAQLVNLQAFMGNLRAWVSLWGGFIMVLMGLAFLRLLPVPFRLSQDCSGLLSASGSWMRRALSWGDLKGRVLLGVATGFLPCMLPWAMMVKAATASGMIQALCTMVLFGLGTVPLLLFLGLSATAVSAKLRLTGEKVAAVSVTVMGLILMFKGARALLRIHGISP